ncbi:unnamed protein product, partial [Staurois parvus]
GSPYFPNKGPLYCPSDSEGTGLWPVGVENALRVKNAPSLVSVGGIVPHHWCQWEE